jgi:hypothetical protein
MAASEGRGFAEAGAAKSKKPTHINKGMRVQRGGAGCMVLGGKGGEGGCRGGMV